MISIIIPVYNQHELTQECLSAVASCSTMEHEIIIIDNGSSPAITAEACIVIRNEENTGFPAAINQGVKAASGDTIILLNNDVVVTPGWDNLLVSQLDNYAITSPATNYAAGIQRVVLDHYENQDELFFVASRLSESMCEPREVNYIIGFCMAFKKELFNQLGGFDDSMWPSSGEEIDFCMKAREAGHKIAVVTRCYVHHYGSQTFEQMQDAGQLVYKQVCDDCWAHLEARWGKEVYRQEAIG